MTFHSADPYSLACFVGLLAFVVAAFLYGVFYSSKGSQKPAKKCTVIAGLLLLVWLGIFASLVCCGFLEKAPMPRLLIAFPIVFLVSVGTAFLPFGRRMAATIPLIALVGVQSFRLPLEIILHSWYLEGVIPRPMTWDGSNFDIIAGILAALIARMLPKDKRWYWGFNVFGILSLINVVRVAIFSSPLPFAWPVKNPLQLAFHLPYAYIVPICVGGAFFGHMILTQSLIRQIPKNKI